MTGIVEAIVGFVKGLRVFRVIDPNERGLRLFCGHIKAHLEPGLHFCWPVIGQIVIREVVEQVMDLRMQSLTTADGVSLGIGLKVSYEITDVEKALYGVLDVDEAIANEATGIIAAAVGDRKWAQITAGDDDLEDEMESAIRSRLERWGVHLLSAQINDLIRLRAFRLIQNGEGINQH